MTDAALTFRPRTAWRRAAFGVFAGFACLALAACGEDDGTVETTTMFEAPAWVSQIGGSSGTTDPTNGDDGSGGPTLQGLRVTIEGVAEPLIVPAGNVVLNETLLTRTLVAPGVANDGSTQLTLSLTFLTAVDPPATFNLVLGPPQSNDTASLAYGETTTSSSNGVTGVTTGRLQLDRWTTTRIDGEFSADVFMADGSRRIIRDGVIRIQRP